MAALREMAAKAKEDGRLSRTDAEIRLHREVRKLGWKPTEEEDARRSLAFMQAGIGATVANRDTRSMRSFTVPWIPHDDVITPQDIQGVRGFGVADAADPLATTMERKLTRMRVKHAQTREYMEVNALRGIVKDGAGTTLYDYFSEFGLTRIEVDFLLGTAGTQVQANVREVLRNVETELKGRDHVGRPRAGQP